jgi:hypothetical protein
VRERFRRWLGRPAAHGLAVAFAVALALPSLKTGFAMDDWEHAAIARGDARWPLAGALPSSPLDLFAFAGKVPGSTRALVDGGVFPWWTDPAVKLSFWRPLASATHWLDWKAWPGAPWLMHAQSLLWLALALVSVSAYYRRFSSAPWVAGLAMWLYAIDDAHTPAVSWVANRNAMIALALALPAVVAHDRWRKDGWRAGAWLGPLALAAGLLAGEAALATGAYLAAYALFLDRGRAVERLRALAPYLLVVVAWRIAYRALGYGTSGSGVYLDPVADALAFVRLFPSRAAYLLSAQLALPWSDLAEMYPYISRHAVRVMTFIALGTVALFALVLAPVCRRSSLARFHATGALLAIVPACSTLPADRLLFFCGVGAFGLLAEWWAQMPRRLPAYAFATLLVLIHVVLAVPFSLLRTQAAITLRRPIERVSDSLPKTPELNRRTLVLMNPPSDYLVGFLAMMRAFRDEPVPRFRWLATGSTAIAVGRPDDRTLELRPDGGFLAQLGERMLRSRPFAVGETVTVPDLTIAVTDVTPDGRPAVARVRFDEPLERYPFYAWRDLGFAPWQPPPVGGSTTLPANDFLKILFTPPEK